MACRGRPALDLNECALDLNRDALDLNSFPLCSPDAPPFRFHPDSAPELLPSHATPTPSPAQAPAELADPWACGLQFQHRQSVSGGNGAPAPLQSFDRIAPSPEWWPHSWIGDRKKTRKARNKAAAHTRSKPYTSPISGSPFLPRNGVIYILEAGHKASSKPGPKHSATQRAAFHDTLQPVRSNGFDILLQCDGSLISLLDLGTPYTEATSEHFLSSRMPEVPMWLQKILPVGVLPDFLDCTHQIPPPVCKMGDNNQQSPNPLRIDLNVEADMLETSGLHEETTGFMMQRHDQDMDMQAMDELHLNSRWNTMIRDTAAEEGPIFGSCTSSNNQNSFISSINQPGCNGLNTAEERCQLSKSSHEEESVEHIHLTPDQTHSQKVLLSCDGLEEHADSTRLLTPENHTKSLKSTRKAQESMQNHNHDVPSPTPLHSVAEFKPGPNDGLMRQKCSSFCQGRQPRLKPVGIRKLQRFKHKEGRVLLALLGRNLCWKWLEGLEKSPRSGLLLEEMCV